MNPFALGSVREAGGPSEASFSHGISIKLKFTMFWLDDNTGYYSSDCAHNNEHVCPIMLYHSPSAGHTREHMIRGNIPLTFSRCRKISVQLLRAGSWQFGRLAPLGNSSLLLCEDKTQEEMLFSRPCVGGTERTLGKSWRNSGDRLASTPRLFELERLPLALAWTMKKLLTSGVSVPFICHSHDLFGQFYNNSGECRKQERQTRQSSTYDVVFSGLHNFFKLQIRSQLKVQ